MLVVLSGLLLLPVVGSLAATGESPDEALRQMLLEAGIY